MKLDRVALRGFLSHEATDWQPDSARMVAIVGPNGAGKSSLLDAVSYALFDAARGRTDDLVRLGASEMSALIEFAFAGERYRVTRGRTTRSGGKSYLELAIADGDGWRPLSGDTIRDTQRMIAELLRLDADTFATAVLLGQGQAGRFVEATPADRKRILGVILSLDVYERAEAKARETARDLEAAVAAERTRIERIETSIDSLADVDERLAIAEAQLAEHEAAAKAAAEERRQAEEFLRTLATSLAGIEAAEADVARITAEMAGHKERWRRADGARSSALDAVGRHTAALARSDAVEAAAAALEATRADVERHEAAERSLRFHEQQLAAAQERFREVEAGHQAARASHDQLVARAQDRVSALEEQVAALAPVTCPDCGARFAADPAGLAERLASAKAELSGIGDPPEPPVRLARERALVLRAELALAAVAFDQDELGDARKCLVDLERTAAAAGEMETHRAALADAEAHAKTAAAELEAIEREGKAARSALQAAQARVDEAAGIRAQRDIAQAALAAIETRIGGLDAARTRLAEARARAQALLEERERLVAERDGVRASIEQAEVAIGRERKLVQAFGRDGIPARIIAGTIPELEAYANELLADVRPGMTVSLRTQRDRKGSAEGSIETLDLVVRDDAGERPLALFSGGEKMSVAIALAVGLSRLVARRAGSRMETLICDEPDGLDATARRAFGHALKVIAHRGDLSRVIVVSHHPDLAEFGDAIYEVSRNGEGSHVELVA